MSVKEKNGETHISAPHDTSEENPRVPGPDENKGGAIGFEKAKGQRAQTPDGLTRIGFGFTKEDRLLKRPEFAKVFTQGKRYPANGITIFYMANALGRSRLGLDISRKVGRATVRNRYKRLLREVFRLNRFLLARDYDLVIRVNPGKRTLGYRNILKEFLIFAEKTAGWQKN